MDTTEATVKFPSGKVIDGKYGPYRDAVLTIGEDEVKIFASKDKPAFEALPQLRKGQTVQVIRSRTRNGRTRYELTDGEINTLLNSDRHRSEQPPDRRDGNGRANGARRKGKQGSPVLPMWDVKAAEAIKKRAGQHVQFLAHI